MTGVQTCALPICFPVTIAGEVCAYRGDNAGGRTGDAAYFLVPESEYDQRGDHGFIIDESRHLRFSNDPTLLTTKELTNA